MVESARFIENAWLGQYVADRPSRFLLATPPEYPPGPTGPDDVGARGDAQAVPELLTLPLPVLSPSPVRLPTPLNLPGADGALEAWPLKGA